MAVIGTAGHVDHGKSTLLEAVTGRDPDRWEEEKRRGLTIDLGFAWTTLPSGVEVSFVDVPGHERFIKNMLAGIEAIDVSLFVVAADEGWMPQSEEHLAVLDVLGMERAVVALTKTDRVDPELVELATLEVLEHLEGTGLEGAPIVAVSAVTGMGLEALISALDEALPPETSGTDPRLWIDRRFTVGGAGTVVTGTLLGGPLDVGDSLVAYPSGERVRVRGLESHEQAVNRALPNRRVAVNLVGAADSLGRGDMLAPEGRWLPTSRFTARLAAARYVDEITERGAYHVHAGSALVPARLRLIEGGVLITLDHPLPLAYGDRFILRETGRRAVVGGGSVLDPDPPRRGRRLSRSASLAAGLAPAGAADALVAIRGFDTVPRLIAHTGAAPREASVVGSVAATRDELERLAARAAELVEEFHQWAPLRPGMPLATLISRVDAPGELVEQVVAGDEALESDGSVVWRRGRKAELNAQQSAAWSETKAMLTEAGLSPPRAADLPIDLEVIHLLMRTGELVQISSEFVFLPEDADRLRAAIAAMPNEFTVAHFRDRLGLSRKYAVPILEWADDQGLTRRLGDVRTPTV